jgi:outer membrane murein-binding lipoprotein Lpp
MSDEPLRARFKNLGSTSDQRKPVELDEVLLGILHRLDDGASERKAALDRLVAIENEMERQGSRGGFARYLAAICIGVAATLAWQSYGEVPKQIIAAKAPELGWSPEVKQMIATWVQTKPPAGSESTVVRPSLPAQVVATVAQTVPAAVVQKAPAAPPIDPEQVHQIAVDLATLGQTVDQLAASQDQMAHQIDTLQTSNQEILASNREILDRIPAPPPPPPPTIAPTHKPTTRMPLSSRAPTSRAYP